MVRPPLRSAFYSICLALCGVIARAQPAVVLPPQQLTVLHIQMQARVTSLKLVIGDLQQGLTQKNAAPQLSQILSTLPDELDRYQALQSSLSTPNDGSSAREVKDAISLAQKLQPLYWDDPKGPGSLFPGQLKKVSERLVQFLSGAEVRFPFLKSQTHPDNARKINQDFLQPPMSSIQTVGTSILQCAGTFDGGVCRAGTTPGLAGEKSPATRAQTSQTGDRSGGVLSRVAARLDQVNVPAPAISAKQACVQAVNGPDPKQPQHPTLAGMCQNHVTLAPLLAGLLDSVEESFGTVGGILTNLAFMLFGLVSAVLTGGVAFVLKGLLLIGMSMTLWQMLSGLLTTLSQYSKAKEGSLEQAAARRQIGMVGGSVLIMALMALVGWGVGKTKPGAAAIKSMESGMRGVLTKTGIMGATASVNSLIPAPVMAALQKLMGTVPVSEAAKSADAIKLPSIGEAPQRAGNLPRSEKSSVQFSEETVLNNARIATRDDRIKAARSQFGVDEKTAHLIAEAHDRVPCAVGDCTPAQLRQKLEIMKPITDPKIPRAAIRSGLAGSLPSDATIVAIPRKNGGVTNGRIMRETSDGRVRVVFDDPILGLQVKMVSPKELQSALPAGLHDIRSGTVVSIPRSSGQRSIVRVVKVEGTKAVVEWSESGKLFQKTVPLQNLQPAAGPPEPALRSIQREPAPQERVTVAPAPRADEMAIRAAGVKLGLDEQNISRALELAAESRRHLPDAIFFSDRNFYDRIVTNMQDQGLKLRVSDYRPRAGDGPQEILAGRKAILEAFLTEVKKLEATGKTIDFKVCLFLKEMTGTQAGKFITIYPSDPAAAVALAARLDAALGARGIMHGRIPPEDLAFGTSGMVSWRYGGFTKESLKLVDAAGRSFDIPDNRSDPMAVLNAARHMPGMDYWLGQAERVRPGSVAHTPKPPPTPGQPAPVRPAVSVRSYALKPLQPEAFSYSDMGPIRLDLGGKKLEIRAYKDIANAAGLGLNPNVGYFVVDPAAPSVFKGLRDKEMLQLGNTSDSRFQMPETVSVSHVRVRRQGDQIIIEDMASTNGTRIER